MNLLQRLRRRHDVASLIEAAEFGPFMGWASGPVNGSEMPAGDFAALVNRAYRGNGPIFALMMVRQMLFAEARFQFRQLRNGRPGDLFGAAALDLLERPWPGGTTGDLMSRMIQDADLAGNAFLTVVDGRIKRLRPDWVTIVTGSKEEPALAGDALDGELLGYVYTPRASGVEEGEVLLPHEVAHFAPIPDPLFHFRGMSWLTPVLREIGADTAATTHKTRFFANAATPKLVVRMDPSVTPELFERFKAKMDAAHAGADNAYRTMYLGGGADVTVAGANLKDLDYKVVTGAGETRMAAAAGVPPVIVGFSEGLAGSSLNAGNYGQARRRLADGTLRPLWRNAAASLATLVQVPAGAELAVDTRDVAFLREDAEQAAQIQQIKSQTIRQLVDAGYEPASVVAAVEAEDMTVLRHTGLFSVQLQPPGTGQGPPADVQTGGAR